RAAALRAARRLRVIVREGQRHVEANRGLAGEEIDGLRTVAEERVDTRGIEAVAGLVAQICARLLLVLDDAPFLCQRRAGNPEPAAGARGGAAEARFLRSEEHLQAVMARGDGSGEARATGADHQDVAFERFSFAVH